MPSRVPLWFLVLLVALAFVGGVGLLSQRAQTMQLRGEVDAVRGIADELPRLQAENLRLRAQQIPAANLALLRADHAAVLRLRAELGALQKIPPTKQP